MHRSYCVLEMIKESHLARNTEICSKKAHLQEGEDLLKMYSIYSRTECSLSFQYILEGKFFAMGRLLSQKKKTRGKQNELRSLGNQGNEWAQLVLHTQKNSARNMTQGKKNHMHRHISPHVHRIACHMVLATQVSWPVFTLRN